LTATGDANDVDGDTNKDEVNLGVVRLGDTARGDDTVVAAPVLLACACDSSMVTRAVNMAF
jgi:hypothetical protein